MSNLNEKFPWGLIVKDHEIGPYTIREYHPGKREGVEVLKMPDMDVTQFHGYIDGKDTHESWNSLEDAMVGLIVRRFLGANNSAINYHFMAGLVARSPTHWKPDPVHPGASEGKQESESP
jgi:hypothetical protein